MGIEDLGWLAEWASTWVGEPTPDGTAVCKFRTYWKSTICGADSWNGEPALASQGSRITTRTIVDANSVLAADCIDNGHDAAAGRRPIAGKVRPLLRCRPSFVDAPDAFDPRLHQAAQPQPSIFLMDCIGPLDCSQGETL